MEATVHFSSAYSSAATLVRLEDHTCLPKAAATPKRLLRVVTAEGGDPLSRNIAPARERKQYFRPGAEELASLGPTMPLLAIQVGTLTKARVGSFAAHKTGMPNSGRFLDRPTDP